MFFDDFLQSRKSVQFFGGSQNDLKHRFDILNKISFAAMNGLIGKCADGFEAALNGLQAVFVGEIVRVNMRQS